VLMRARVTRSAKALYRIQTSMNNNMRFNVGISVEQNCGVRAPTRTAQHAVWGRRLLLVSIQIHCETAQLPVTCVSSVIKSHFA
jgi:hypothetical protein